MTGGLTHLPVLRSVHEEAFDPERPFERIAACLAGEEGTVVLLSGSDLDCARYHLLAVRPWLSVQSRRRRVTVQCRERVTRMETDVLEVIQGLVDRFRLSDVPSDSPVCAGLFGYLAYDLKDLIERLPRTCAGHDLPDLSLYAPSLVLVHDRQTGKTRLFIPELSWPDDGEPAENRVREIKNWFLEKIEKPVPEATFGVDGRGFESSLTKQQYLSSVRKIIDYLRAGDIYQANFSQRFEAGFSGDAYALFLDLYRRNPAAFFAYIHAGDHRVVSTSPERFVRQTGRRVETRPIKGTAARGKTPAQDRENGIRLERSVKDDAELTMIVDLMRNDLSRVATHGSVRVREHKRLEAYENVFHLVSIVEGTLRDDQTSIDLIRATFPGGSITGCPKIRSMEIIDELEPVRRHVYTGSIGYIGFHDTMDLSIAIRTAVIGGGRIYFSVGGGIVYDSDPEKEFQETLDKGKTLMDSLTAVSGKQPTFRPRAWIDGRQVDQDQARVLAAGIGFQYGAGLFETIRVDRGVIFRLPGHLARMNRSWESLFGRPAPDITWEHVILPLIRINGLADKTAAVKLIMARRDPDEHRGPFLAAFAREYEPRPAIAAKNGLDLITFPYPRRSFLADHKTLNYLYYYQAGQYARANRGDEALILNADGTVSETNTASLLFVENGCVTIPQSEHCLPGVTLNAVLTILSGRGYDVRKLKIGSDDLPAHPNILLTNALMGAVRVMSVDGREIKHDKEVCTMINRALFGIETK